MERSSWWVADYFTSSKTNGAPTSSILTIRRGESLATDITIGTCPPAISSRNIWNVPAGTVTAPPSDAFICSTVDRFCPDSNTFTLNVFPASSGSAEITVVKVLSSTIPAAAVVSIDVVLVRHDHRDLDG